MLYMIAFHRLLFALVFSAWMALHRQPYWMASRAALRIGNGRKTWGG